MLKIDKALPQDIVILAPLLTDWVRNQQVPFLLDYQNTGTWLSRCLTNPEYACFVVYEDHQAIGWLLGKLSNYTFTESLFAQEISWYVIDGHRGKGVGKELMLAFTKWAKENKASGVISTILLSASKDSGKAAMSGLLKEGFSEFERTFYKAI